MITSTRMLALVGLLAVGGVAAAAANAIADSSAPFGRPTAAPMAAAMPASATPATAVASAATGRTHKKVLLFFMNPNGYPCQTQLGILRGVADSLTKVADVVLVQTTQQSDLPRFEAYGIRALPSLVIADETGRELTRLSPGIQGADAVLAALTR